MAPYSGIWIPLPSSTKKKKRQSWTHPDKTFWIRGCSSWLCAARSAPLYILCLERTIVKYAALKFTRIWLVSVAEQAGMSLTWVFAPKIGFLNKSLIESTRITIMSD